MASADKVNPRFVRETKAHKQDCSSDDTDDILVRMQRKLEKLGKKRKKDQKRRNGLVAMTWS